MLRIVDVVHPLTWKQFPYVRFRGSRRRKRERLLSWLLLPGCLHIRSVGKSRNLSSVLHRFLTKIAESRESGAKTSTRSCIVASELFQSTLRLSKLNLGRRTCSPVPRLATFRGREVRRQRWLQIIVRQLINASIRESPTDVDFPVMVHRLCHPKSAVYLWARYQIFEKQGEASLLSHGQDLRVDATVI